MTERKHPEWTYPSDRTNASGMSVDTLAITRHLQALTERLESLTLAVEKMSEPDVAAGKEYRPPHADSVRLPDDPDTFPTVYTGGVMVQAQTPHGWVNIHPGHPPSDGDRFIRAK